LRSSLGQPNNKRYASWHICIDRDTAIECIPLDEVAWHAGDGNGPGNMHSIGIEVCEVDGAEQAAIELIAKMLKERGWGIDRVKKHQDWSGKNCPRLIIPHWQDFINNIQSRLNGEEKEGPKVKYLVVYGKKEDKAAAEMLAYRLQCPVMDADIPFDYSTVKNVYCVGAPGQLPFTSYAKAVIAGLDRVGTMQKVLNFKVS
jgi:hypothetical protein